jgi:hypothetical protein
LAGSDGWRLDSSDEKNPARENLEKIFPQFTTALQDPGNWTSNDGRSVTRPARWKSPWSEELAALERSLSRRESAG